MGRVQLVEELPNYHEFNQCIIGSFSITTGQKTNQVRYLRQSDCIEVNGVIDTPARHFRDIMKTLYTTKRNPTQSPTYPYLAKAGKVPYAFYVDIRKAYLQIASVYGAECYIREDAICSYGDYNFSDPLFINSRVARGLIITGTQEKGYVSEWNGKDIVGKKFPNSLYAPHLRAAVMFTLHAVMSELSRYIVYAHTDGFIVPSWYLSQTDTILSQWGLLAAIKAEGSCTIKGIGSYQIGSKTTLNYHRQRSHGSPTNIVTSSPQWWKNMFCRGKAKRMRSNSLLDLN